MDVEDSEEGQPSNYLSSGGAGLPRAKTGFARQGLRPVEPR